MSWGDHVTERELETLEDLREDLGKLEARIRAEVAYLRQAEVPWSVIGARLGVSKQAAQQRFGSTRTSTVDRPMI